jgi:hypothetical protein
MAQPKRRDTAARVLAVENLTAKVLRQSVDQVAKRAGASRMAPSYAALVVQATATLAITKAHEAARAKAADVFEAQTGLAAADDEGEDRSRAQQAGGAVSRRPFGRTSRIISPPVSAQQRPTAQRCAISDRTSSALRRPR